MQNLGFEKKLHHHTGNDKVTELLRCLAKLWFYLAFYREKKHSVRNVFQSVRYAFLNFVFSLCVYLKKEF